MSPSRDESVLKKMDPPAGQRWFRAGASGPAAMDRIEPFPGARRARRALQRGSRACALDQKEERQLKKAVLADDALTRWP
jgi:hypothetical protein